MANRWLPGRHAVRPNEPLRRPWSRTSTACRCVHVVSEPGVADEPAGRDEAQDLADLAGDHQTEQIADPGDRGEFG